MPRSLRPLLAPALLALSLIACSSSSPDADPASGGAEPAQAETEAAASGSPSPLAGLSDAQICEHDELLLLKWSVEELMAGGWKTHCCGPGTTLDPGRCELDWPSSDVLACSAWGAMRVAMEARYGYPFPKTEWKASYGKWEWYERREDYDRASLPEVAQANLTTLERFEAEGTNCQK